MPRGKVKNEDLLARVERELREEAGRLIAAADAIRAGENATPGPAAKRRKKRSDAGKPRKRHLASVPTPMKKRPIQARLEMGTATGMSEADLAESDLAYTTGQGERG